MAAEQIDRFQAARAQIMLDREKAQKVLDQTVAREVSLTGQMLHTFKVRRTTYVEDETIWDLVNLAAKEKVDPSRLLDGYMSAAAMIQGYIGSDQESESVENPDKLREIAMVRLQGISGEGVLHRAFASAALEKALEIQESDPNSVMVERVLNQYLLDNIGILEDYSKKFFWANY